VERLGNADDSATYYFKDGNLILAIMKGKLF